MANYIRMLSKKGDNLMEKYFYVKSIVKFDNNNILCYDLVTLRGKKCEKS